MTAVFVAASAAALVSAPDARATASLLRHCVTVFGFPPHRAALVLPALLRAAAAASAGGSAGGAGARRDPAAPDAAVAVLALGSASAAEAVLSRNGALVGGYMIGVKPTERHEVSAAFLLSLAEEAAAQANNSHAAAYVKSSDVLGYDGDDDNNGEDYAAKQLRAGHDGSDDSSDSEQQLEQDQAAAVAAAEAAAEAEAEEEAGDIFDLDAHMQRQARVAAARRSRSRSAAPGKSNSNCSESA